MGRVGVFCRQAVGLIADLAGRKGVSIVGAMTTLNEDAEFEKLQLQRFREVEETLAASGIASGTRLRASPLFDNSGGVPGHGAARHGALRSVLDA